MIAHTRKTSCLSPVLILITLTFSLASYIINAQENSFVIITQATAKPQVDCKLRMGWDEVFPLQFTGKKGNPRGLQIDLVKNISKGLNCEIVFYKGHWADLLLQLKSGTIDVMPDMTITNKRQNFSLFSLPYRNERLVLYVRNNDVDKYTTRSISTLLDNGFRLGLTKGYSYASEINNFIDNADYVDAFIFANDNFDNYQLLVNKKIDGFLEEPGVAGFSLRKRNITHLVKAIPSKIYYSEVSFGFSKKTIDQAFVQRFNQQLIKIMNTQEFKRKWKIVK